ncbi:PQQ-dependent sugar dehydrogenase [Ornithinimicrobium murale]|uniref:PQQ-dependent sugar dehydrogenase n=1 Tax=Ornithinimicrobium murale TaxID=1050153 RepID=UPI000E0D10A7|nr:PQQ-dependent sugar dehydrogenase [Ornithinimicrobium murale]
MATRPLVRLSVLAFAVGGLVACSGSTHDQPSSSPSATAEAAATPRTPDSAEGAATADPDAAPSPGSTGLDLLEVSVTAPREVVTLDDGTLLISDQVGVVHVVTADGAARPEPLLDVQDSIKQPGRTALEAGLAGFEVAPDFADSGHVYTTTTHSIADVDRDLPQGTRQVNILSRWTVDPSTLVADPESEEQLMVLPSRDADHVGGEIVFDDDGLLYTSLGAPSRDEAAQDPASYAGTVLRIDPTPAEGTALEDRAYGIPEDNPFADGAGGLPEVYSYGYRNPWRLSWDSEHGLLVGEAMSRDKDQQVGQPAAGDNAGYPEVTGSCWGQDRELSGACRETEAGMVIAPPVMEYGPEVGEILSGVTVGTGGDLEGQVIVTDWLGTVLVTTPGEAPWKHEIRSDGKDLTGHQSYVWDVDSGPDGSLYVLTAGRSMAEGKGAVLRLAPEELAR